MSQDKAKEHTKVADLNGKINAATQAISRTTSLSTKASKAKDVLRYQNDLATVHKKIADFEGKIVKKQQELHYEQKRVSDEEDREQKKRETENEKQARDHNLQMNRISQTLSSHASIHRDTNQRLLQLQKLPEKITVLFLAANPLDQQSLRLDEEARAIHEMITKAKLRDSIQFETRWAVRTNDLLQAMNEVQPTIVHFSGHGSDADQIIFHDSQGNAKPVSKEAIVHTMMVASDNLRLVFFNTCYSYNQASAVTKHIEAAIGMNTSIGDDAARIFAAQFYSSIGFGHSLQKAFDQARAAIMLENIREENTPELFVQGGLDAADIVIVKPQDIR